MSRTRLVLPVMIFAMVPVGAAFAWDEPSESIVVQRCQVDFEKTALLGASLPGVLGECSVKLGDRVEAGRVLARLQDRDIKAEFALRSAMAENDIEIKVAEARASQARAKLYRAENLGRQVLVSVDELEALKTELHTRLMEVEEARHKQVLARLQERQAEASLRDREFVSPFDGVVVALLKAPGESVSVNDPILRVIDPRVMRVTAAVDVIDAWKLRNGQRVRVQPEVRGAEMAIEQEFFEGHITFVDSQLDRDTQTCKVIAEIENRDNRLRAGMEARMVILIDEASPPPSGPANEAASAATRE